MTLLGAGDPDVSLLGLSFPNEQDAAFAAAEGFRRRSAGELAEIRERAILAMRDTRDLLGGTRRE